jgi:trans-2-enoyl-CoA reductase
LVEVEDLLTEMEVVDNEGTARTNPKRVLVIGNWAALGGC